MADMRQRLRDEGPGRRLAITRSRTSLMGAIFTLIIAKVESIDPGRKADL
jgi:hypothetical protein